MSNVGANNHPGLWLDSLPRLTHEMHKYERGHALVLGGFPMTGAARLAARAAARAGAGLTTVAVPEAAFSIYAQSLTSIMVHPLTPGTGLADLLLGKSFSACLVGPGAGVGAETRMSTLMLLATRWPTLLDADALTSFSDTAADLFAAIAGDCVMTPHEGEYGRIFADEGTRAERARIGAQRSGAVVVLKGRET